jgi:hypothetical protein
MARYIRTDELLKTARDGFHSDFGRSMADLTSLREVIEDTPTADVVEVQHGKWKRKGQGIYCSVCGNESAYNPFGASKFSDYCPNCGAKMDVSKKEITTDGGKAE